MIQHCTGNCEQGRKPCDCPLEADHGNFVSPSTKFIENILALTILLIAIVGVTILFMEAT